MKEVILFIGLLVSSSLCGQGQTITNILVSLAVRSNSYLSQNKGSSIEKGIFYATKDKLKNNKNIILDSDSKLGIVCDYTFTQLANSQAGFINVQRIKHNIQWDIINIKDGTVYGSKSYTENTIGYGIDDCFNSFITTLENDSISLERLVFDGAKQHISYYEEHCDNLINDSNEYKQRGDFSKALSILNLIPKNTKCHSEIQHFKFDIYIAIQKEKELEILNIATQYWIQENYGQALKNLNSIKYLRVESEALKQNVITAIHQEKKVNRELQILQKEEDIISREFEIREKENELEIARHCAAERLERMRIKHQMQLQEKERLHEIRIIQEELKSAERIKIVEAIESISVSAIEIFDPFSYFFKIITK